MTTRRLNVMQMTDVTGRGGAEKALVDLALGLDRSRYNVTVCATRTAGNYQPLLDAAGVRRVILERQGRWGADKGGQDHLIRAVQRLRATRPEVRLLVVGEGPLRPGLEALAAAQGLGDAVRFTGQRPDVARLLDAMDIFVLPSLHEALP